MAAITTRQTGTTGTDGVTRIDAPLTNTQIDNNFISLNNGKLEKSSNLNDLTSAGTARTNLGATTLGGNLFTITNPGAITFPRFNANNTVSSLTATDLRTDIAAQPLDSDLTAIAGLSGTGIIVRTGTGTANTRSLASGNTDYISLTNADGVSGNPSINVGSKIVKTDADATWTTTGFIDIPSGTTAQRPTSLSAGQIRFNTSTGFFEGYNGSAWVQLQGPAGGGANGVFYENDNTVTANYTISTNKNAMSAGPITINNGITVTIPSGSEWTVI